MSFETKCPICGENVVWAKKDYKGVWKNPDMSDLLAWHLKTKHPESGGSKLVTRVRIWIIGLFFYFVAGLLQLTLMFYGRPTRNVPPSVSDGTNSIFFLPSVSLYIIIGLILTVAAWRNIAPIRTTWKDYLSKHKQGGPGEGSGISEDSFAVGEDKDSGMLGQGPNLAKDSYAVWQSKDSE